MRNYKRSTAIVALTGGLLLVPELCFAGAGAQALATFIQNHLINQALIAFAGIAAAAIFYYAFRIVLQAYNEQSLTEASKTFAHVFAGFAVIAISGAFVSAFHATINPSALIPGINSITDYIFLGAQGVFTLIIVVAGIGMVTSQGDQAAFSKWLKILLGNCIGVMIMVLAQILVTAIQSRDANTIKLEMIGIALFLLTIIGFAAVIALMLAGIMLIISIDEGLRDKAKRIVFGTLISLAIVVASYTLIITFVP